jgi:hypothetical protein
MCFVGRCCEMAAIRAVGDSYRDVERRDICSPADKPLFR